MRRELTIRRKIWTLWRLWFALKDAGEECTADQILYGIAVLHWTMGEEIGE